MKLALAGLIIVFGILTCAANTPGQQTSSSAELPNFHQVNANLYRGAQPKTGGFDKLAKLGVKTVINLRDDDERAVAEEKEVRTAGMSYFNIPFARFDSPHEDQLAQVMAIIEDPKRQPVFVHCRRGADRTGTVIAVYRIERGGWTGEQAQSEADRFGMGFWHVKMKGFIREYYDRRAKHKDLVWHPKRPE